MTVEGHPALPDVLADRLRPERVLGTGSFGTVVLARTADGSPVAVKLLDPQVAAQPQLRARFQREVQAGRAVRSRHVVALEEGGIDGGVAYLVLEYVEGRPLDELLETEGRCLTRDEADRILDQALEGVQDLHAAGLVHRDLKPANILVESGGRVVLVDLGLVRGVADATLTLAGQVLGTPLYMSPEQMKGEAVGPASDLYALGVIYFEMLAGRPPFDGDSMGEILDAKLQGAPGLRAERVDVSVALDRMMRTWLAPDPGARFADGAALRVAWEVARAGGGEAHKGGATVEQPVERNAATRPLPSPVLAAGPSGAPRAASSGAWPRLAALAVAGVSLVALGYLRDGADPPSPLSHQGRARLEVLRQGVMAPAIDDAVNLTGPDRSPEVQATWKAGLEAFEDLLRSEEARSVAEELEGVRLAAAEAEDLGKVLLRHRLLAHYLGDSGAFAHRRSELVERLERAFREVVAVARYKALDSQTPWEQGDGPLDEIWAWSLGGDARRQRERTVVEALGGTWELVRRWDRDFQRYDFDHPSNIRPRLRKLALSGAPFVDPSEYVNPLLKMARGRFHTALRRQDPHRLEVAVRDTGGRSLVLAGTAVRWNPTIHGVLTLVGSGDQVELPFDVPSPGQGSAHEAGHELNVGFLLRVAPEVLPEGLEEVRIQAFGLQPIGTIDQLVDVAEVYQQVAGELPEPLAEVLRE